MTNQMRSLTYNNRNRTKRSAQCTLVQGLLEARRGLVVPDFRQTAALRTLLGLPDQDLGSWSFELSVGWAGQRYKGIQNPEGNR